MQRALWPRRGCCARPRIPGRHVGCIWRSGTLQIQDDDDNLGAVPAIEAKWLSLMEPSGARIRGALLERDGGLRNALTGAPEIA